MLNTSLALLSSGMITLAGINPGVHEKLMAKHEARVDKRAEIAAQHKVKIQKHRGDHIAALATALGITADDLTARLASGKKLPEIIADLKLNAPDVQKKLAAAHLTEMKTQLQTQITAGKITQAQADAKIAAMQKAIDDGKLGMLKMKHDNKGKGHGGFAQKFLKGHFKAELK